MASMFADIADYMDPDYFEKHQSIVIYTGEKKIELTPVYLLYGFGRSHLQYRNRFSG